MKKIKRMLALLVAMVMVMGMTVTAMAAENEVPSASDTKAVKVSNVETGSTVTAYQIIEAKYNDYGFIGYKWANSINKGVDVEDVNKELTDELITELAAGDLSALKASAPVTASNNEAVLTLNAGTWMVIVTPPTGDAEKVYNPMIASVYYTKDGVFAGSVDANDNWELTTKDAYAKSSTITLEKEAVEQELEVGEEVEFTIVTTIPSYSDEYEEVFFKVTDTIVNGLKYTEDAPVVTVGEATVNVDEAYTYTKKDTSFEINFKEEYIKQLAMASTDARKVVVSYSATITDDAVIQAAENKATIEYTNKPGENSGYKEDTEYTFTFELNGVMEKVDEDLQSLAGAEFTLFTDEDLTKVFATYTTDETGNIKFQGLDAEKTYYLKETDAPGEYSLNDTVYEVRIENVKYGDDGKVTTYDVMINGEKKATINYGTPAENFGERVINTKLSSLPSTGGIGTTIFTIGGCAIMIAAAGLFFASRRKESK